MSIFDMLFEKVTGGRKPVDNTPSPNNNNTVPGNTNTPPADNSNASPLANYAELWQPVKADPNNPQPDRAVKLAMDPEKLREAVGKVDFTKAIKPEDLAAAAKGDSGAMAAIINQASQAGMAHMLAASANIVESALAKQAAIFENTILPEAVAKAGDKTAVAGKLDIAKNPVFAPLVETVSNQIRLKNPQATDAEVADHAHRIFSELGKELTGGSNTTNTGSNSSAKPQGKEMDWVEYMQS